MVYEKIMTFNEYILCYDTINNAFNVPKYLKLI